MSLTTMLVYLVLIVVLVSSLVVVICYIRQNTLDEIREDVYQLFLKAEHKFKHGDNKKKIEYVIQQARGLLPAWARFFITDALIEKVIEIWYMEIKDLLDDGKLNKSAKEE